MKKIFMIATLAISMHVYGQDSVNHFFAVEFDPLPFISGGYSVSLKYSPKIVPKTLFMGSVFSSNFPNKMMSKTNMENGWTNMTIERSYAIFTDFFLNNQRKGFYYGPSAILYNKSVAQKSTDERIYFSTIYPSFTLGYIWYPFPKFGFYLNPWFNLGSEISLDENNRFNDKIFTPNRFNYIMTLHIGYSFSFI